jgi:HAD superfamily hydrolase (TIGR01549 family)
VSSPSPRCAVGFDFDHTLGIDNKLERVAFLHLLESMPQQELTLTQEIERIDELLALQRSGAFSIDEAVARFAHAHRHSGDPAPLAQRFKRFALDGVEEFVVPLPGLRGLLAALQQAHVAMAILSNGWSPLQQRKAEWVGFPGPVLASDRIGAQKPDARAFAALVAELGTPASGTWYVGDNPAVDVAGSMAAGLHGVWLDAEAATYPEDLPRPAATVGDLRRLVEILPL